MCCCRLGTLATAKQSAHETNVDLQGETSFRVRNHIETGGGRNGHSVKPLRLDQLQDLRAILLALGDDLFHGSRWRQARMLEIRGIQNIRVCNVR